MPAAIAIATYNVHSCVGIDRRRDCDRIARVIAELSADIVGLQEVESRAGDAADLLDQCARSSGYKVLSAPTICDAESGFGNALLTRLPVRSFTRIKLESAQREPRGALDVLLECENTPLRVVTTHLGLSRFERERQVAQLLDIMRSGPSVPTVLLGDLNEWLLPRRALRRLRDFFGTAPTPATFPSLLPMFALDRIWMLPACALTRVRAHKSRTARLASDHLPLIAEINCEQMQKHDPIAQRNAA
jgi:endonuclease/exonuclease/phosphatase family metal-dependent hydrolase